MNNPKNPRFKNRRSRQNLTTFNPPPQPRVQSLHPGEAAVLGGQILWTANALGAITHLNPTWQTYTGMDLEASLAWGFLQALHPEDRPLWHRTFAGEETSVDLPQKRLGVVVWEMELRLLGIDGIYRWMLVQAVPTWGKNGEVVAWAGTYTDIDSLKQTQLQLQEKQEFIENVIASCSEAIIAGDANGTIQIFNQAAQKLYGAAEEKSSAIALKSGQTGEKLVSGFHLSRSTAQDSMGNVPGNSEVVEETSTPLETLPLEEALQTEFPSEKELVLVPKSGQTRIILGNSNPIFNPGGIKLGAVTLMRDITQRKQREQACFTLYAETQQQVRVLHTQLLESDRRSPLQHPPLPPATAPESVEESGGQTLPQTENETEFQEFAELFQALNIISPYDMAGLLWDRKGELQGVMDCHRLLADSLWERLEKLLLGVFPDAKRRSLDPEAVVWSISLPEGSGDDETPITELASMLLFPIMGRSNPQPVGLLFLVAEGRSPMSAYQLGLLEGLVQQVSETLQRLFPSYLASSSLEGGSGNSRCDRPGNSLENPTVGFLESPGSAEIAPENLAATAEERGQATPTERQSNHSRCDRDRASAASASNQPSPDNRGALPVEVFSLLSQAFNPSRSPHPQNLTGASPVLAGGEPLALNDPSNRSINHSREAVSNCSESFPCSPDSPDPNPKPGVESSRVQKNYPPGESDLLYDSVNYCREMEGWNAREKMSEPTITEGPSDPPTSGEATGDEGILIYDAHGILTTCNPSAERILGLKAGELIGRSYQEPGYSSVLSDGSPLEGDRHPVAVTFQTGQPQSHTILGIYKPDQTLTWISLDVQLLFDNDFDNEERHPCAVIACFRQMDSTTEGEHSREQGQPQYQFIVEQSKDLIARHSPRGIYLYASSASCCLLGYEPGELIGQSIYGFVHREDVATVSQILNSLSRESAPDRVTYRHRRKDGTYVWLETTLRLALNPERGLEPEAIAVSRDITPRKENEEKTFALNQELNCLVRKQSLQLEAARQLKDELLLREQLARKVAEAAKTLLSTERQRIAESRSFLAEATTLLTTSLDYQTTLENLAGLLVPRFGDWCAINVRESEPGPSGSSEENYRCVAVACMDPAQKEAVWALQKGYPADGGGQYLYLQQLLEIRRSPSRSDWGERENGADFCFGISDDELIAIAQDPEHLALLRSLDCQAYVWLPIRFGDRTFGSILLVCGNHQHSRRLRLQGDATYSQSDLSLIEDLVRRGAMTLEKALLYREARETGENLRQTVCIVGERQRQLRTLQQLANLLNQRIADLPRLLQLMVEAVCEAIPKAQFCLIVLHDRKLNRLELMATAGTGTQNLPIGIPLKTKDSLLSQVFSTGQPLLRCHSLDGLNAASERETLPGELPACVYAVPIESARAGRLGVLAVGNWEEQGAFEVEDLRQMVTAVGEQAAIAINNARSIEILEERDQLLQAQNHILACQNQELEAKRQQIEHQNWQLREASRLKSEFLATMSHELRTPMNSILGFSQVLLRGRRHPLPDQQKQMVERILNNGKQLLALIDDILDLSKIEAGHSELKLEEFEVDLLVSATCEELRVFAQKKNLTLQFSSTLDNPLVVGDRLRLRQVVTNLVSNAIKFTNSGGVEVTLLSSASDCVEISVKDTGIGIPQEQLNHIFEAFRQGDQTTTREYSGTGLGLALSNSLVRLMQGTISVESQLNEGSTFSIHIPRAFPALSERE